jgi:hypothetical protein
MVWRSTLRVDEARIAMRVAVVDEFWVIIFTLFYGFVKEGRKNTTTRVLSFFGFALSVSTFAAVWLACFDYYCYLPFLCRSFRNAAQTNRR